MCVRDIIKNYFSYTGEIVTEIHLPPKSTHSSATTTIIPTFFRNDYEGGKCFMLYNVTWSYKNISAQSHFSILFHHKKLYL